MQNLLSLVQEEAAKYNSHLNKDKIKLIVYNTDNNIVFADGTLIQKVHSISYFGGLIDQRGRAGPEEIRPIREARRTFRGLARVWRHARLSTGKKLAIYKAYLIIKILYNLSIFWLMDMQLN